VLSHGVNEAIAHTTVSLHNYFYLFLAIKQYGSVKARCNQKLSWWPIAGMGKTWEI